MKIQAEQKPKMNIGQSSSTVDVGQAKFHKVKQEVKSEEEIDVGEKKYVQKKNHKAKKMSVEKTSVKIEVERDFYETLLEEQDNQSQSQQIAVDDNDFQNQCETNNMDGEKIFVKKEVETEDEPKVMQEVQGHDKDIVMEEVEEEENGIFVDDEEDEDQMDKENEAEVEGFDSRPLLVLIREYSSAFPSKSSLFRKQIPRNSSRLLVQYRAKDLTSDPRCFGTPLTTLMKINFIQHALKNKMELRNTINRIKQSIEKCKSIETNHKTENTSIQQTSKLNFHIQKFCSTLNDIPENFLTGSNRKLSNERLGTNDNTSLKNTKLFYMNLAAGKTTLQKILRNNFSEPMDVPANGYPLETRGNDKWHPMNLTMPFELFCCIVSESLNKLANTFDGIKNWYVEYIGRVAESNQEFLLAVISAYVNELSKNNVMKFPVRALELFQLRDMLLPECRLNSSISISKRTRDDSVLPHRNFELLKRLIAQPANSNLLIPPAIAKKTFVEVVQRLWSMFYGPEFTVPSDLLPSWGKRVHVFMEKRRRILQITYSIVLRDSQSKDCQIPHLNSAQIETLQNHDLPLLEERKRKYEKRNFNLKTENGLMCSEMSTLQLSLVEAAPVNFQVPEPNGWTPSNCDFPFGIFEEIVRAKAKDAKEEEAIQFGSEGMKVRYAEMLAVSTRGLSRQLLLGIFTAFGPNLYEYPTRVIQILQHKKLIRKGSGLPEYVTLPPSQKWQGFVCMEKKEAEKEFNPLISPLSISPTSANLVTIGRPSPTPRVKNEYMIWRSAAEEGLKAHGLPTLGHSEFDEIYARHHTYSKRNKKEFAQGVFTGICITLQAKKKDELHSSSSQAREPPLARRRHDEDVSTNQESKSKVHQYSTPTSPSLLPLPLLPTHWPMKSGRVVYGQADAPPLFSLQQTNDYRPVQVASSYLQSCQDSPLLNYQHAPTALVQRSPPPRPLFLSHPPPPLHPLFLSHPPPLPPCSLLRSLPPPPHPLLPSDSTFKQMEMFRASRLLGFPNQASANQTSASVSREQPSVKRESRKRPLPPPPIISKKNSSGANQHSPPLNLLETNGGSKHEDSKCSLESMEPCRRKKVKVEPVENQLSTRPHFSDHAHRKIKKKEAYHSRRKE